MKNILIILSLVAIFASCKAQQDTPTVIATDIENFWNAYDKITSTRDSIQQYAYLDNLFLQKGTPGLHAMMARKNYTPKSYIDAINNYPKFWNSVRQNTYRASEFAEAIEAEIAQLKQLYPDLKPSTIYFTIGALLSGGTTLDDMVLIGSEIALADSTAVTEELPDWFRANLRTHFDSNPIEDVVLLNVHECVHTQQRPQGGYDLLSQCLYEGVAEFVSVVATGKPSVAPCIAFGQANEARVKARFTKEIFSPNYNDWLYNNFDNEFEIRDLGYYVGYAICEAYYEKASDKQAAIKALIEIDYGSSKAVERIVEASGYFDTSIAQLKANYEQLEPELIGIREFKNGAKNVSPDLTEITFEFSREMSERFGRFEPGLFGKNHVIPITKFLGLTEDGKGLRYAVDLKPNQRYQRKLMPVFRAKDGAALKKPVLVKFRTGTS